MWKSTSGAAAFALGLSGAAMAQEQIRISSVWGEVTATLADNDAAGALLEMLPLTIDMRDHLHRKRRGTCHLTCPNWRDSATSRPARSVCGVPTTS
jgi:hypothetical protein